MLLMPGNHAGWFVHHWNALCPGLFAHLWSPPRAVNVYPHLDYACDNYRYAAMQNGSFWSARSFRQWVAQIKHLSRPPLFLVVPDLPRNARATLKEWQVWEEELRQTNIPLAFAVQDGIKLEQVPPSADWLFVGGTDEWRYPRLREITSMGKPVHVGRVNTIRRVRQCDEAGVISVDGNGWFTGDRYQMLLPYIQERQNRLISGGVGVSLSVEQLSLLPPSPDLVPVLKRWQQQGIPENIQTHHLLSAISNWQVWLSAHPELSRRHRLRRYAVRYRDMLHPPKLLISIANIYINGAWLPSHAFSGGRDTNHFLERRGFEVVELCRSQAQRLSSS